MPTGSYCGIVYVDTNGNTQTTNFITGDGTFRTIAVTFSNFDHFLRLQIGIRADATTVNASNVHIMFSKTQPTAWQPYENICPISGHTEVVTHRTGKNLFDKTATDAQN